MKRFYCTLCARIRRSNNYPAEIALTYREDSATGVAPVEPHVLRRTGICWRHGASRPMPRAVRAQRVTSKPVAATPKPQQRKRR